MKLSVIRDLGLESFSITWEMNNYIIDSQHMHPHLFNITYHIKCDSFHRNEILIHNSASLLYIILYIYRIIIYHRSKSSYSWETWMASIILCTRHILWTMHRFAKITGGVLLKNRIQTCYGYKLKTVSIKSSKVHNVWFHLYMSMYVPCVCLRTCI